VEEQSSDRDALTGLGNRGEAFSLLRRDLAGGTAGAVILCDLDHFAAFNGSNGHHQGDRLLRLVGTTLAPPGEDALSHDAYRIGGDEFLIRMPGAELQAAKALAEEARRKIKLLPGDLKAVQSEDEPHGAFRSRRMARGPSSFPRDFAGSSRAHPGASRHTRRRRLDRRRSG